MAFCMKCGAECADEMTFCPSCGAPLAGNTSNNQGNAYQANFAGNTTFSAEEDINKNKGYAVLAYLGILILVPIFAAPKSEFARFHVNQSLVNIIFAIAYSIVERVITNIVPWAVFDYILSLGGLFFVVMVIIGMVNAGSGKKAELPLIGKIRLLK